MFAKVCHRACITACICIQDKTKTCHNIRKFIKLKEQCMFVHVLINNLLQKEINLDLFLFLYKNVNIRY